MSLHETLLAMNGRLLDAGDESGAEKLRQLADKATEGLCMIACCGHFSAGKSSLINALCGAKLLPSGPIPTSANLITIRNGAPEALVSFKSGREKPEPVPVDDVFGYSKDGEQVERIDIAYPIDLLSDKLMLMDTPGVDSTDDAHRQATQSALHLADVVLYITDYNHVLSEMNFAFLKQLTDWNKPVYLIVNQIDKHDEQELAFADYRSEVSETFAAWGIVTAGILFISVKDRRHHLGQWHELLWLLAQLGEQADGLRRSGLAQSAAHIAEEHARRLFAGSETGDGGERGEGEADDQQADADNGAEQLRSELDRLERELEESRTLAQRQYEQQQQEADKLIASAHVMPAALRDVAAAYLASRKPGFKAGLLFAERKTKQEIERRRGELARALGEQAERQLVWFLNDMLLKHARSANLTEEIIASDITPVVLEVSEEWVAAEVNTAAGFTDQYTMTYSSVLADRLRSLARRQALERLDAIRSYTAHSEDRKSAELAAQAAELRRQLAALEEADSHKRRHAEYTQELVKPLRGWIEQAALWPDVAQAPVASTDIAMTPNAELVAETQAPQPSWTEALTVADAVAVDGAAAVGNVAVAGTAGTEAGAGAPSLAAPAAKRLRATADALDGIPTMEELRRSLLDRADKLETRRFTVALFGAFSAGKSSFVNALLGAAIVPVSPNPTTAAINTIKPPEPEWPDRTARIVMKPVQSIIDDVRFSLSMLGHKADCETIEQAKQAIDRLDGARIAARNQPHYSFLRAVAGGYDDAASLLGTSWKADMDQYRAFVADELKSCFVEAIDLHIDSPLARQGILIVDTPGADSIHARHTGVAFNYIKNADAILFVTYYNHAFSQADQQFLAQLGRVKGSFALDKMFFILNAADLADSPEELADVSHYVTKELQKHGLVKPRLFPLSSRAALAAKLAADNETLRRCGLPQFEASFRRFVRDELEAAAIAAGDLEAGRAADAMSRFLQQARQGSEERANQRAQWTTAARELQQRLASAAETTAAGPVRQELRELLFYAKQRCMFRFGEWFNDAFHPSVLQDDGRNIAVALQSAWRHLQHTIGIELSHEALAASLRIETFIRQMAQRSLNDWLAAATSALPGFTPVLTEADEQLGTPQLAAALEEPEGGAGLIRKHYKNARAFFEGEGKQKLRAALEPVIEAAATACVAAHEHQLGEYYEQAYTRMHGSALKRLSVQIDEYLRGLDEAERSLPDARELESRLARISQQTVPF